MSSRQGSDSPAGDGLMTKEPASIWVGDTPLSDGYISWSRRGDRVETVWIGGREDTLSRTLRAGTEVTVVIRRAEHEVRVESATVQQIMPPHIRLLLSPEDA